MSDNSESQSPQQPPEPKPVDAAPATPPSEVKPTDASPATPPAEPKSEKKEEGGGVRMGLETLGHYDEMGRFRIKWDALMSFIGDLLKGFGYNVDVNDRDALGRAMDEARRRAIDGKDQLVQMRDEMEAAQARVRELEAENKKLKDELAEKTGKLSEAEAKIAELLNMVESLKTQLDAMKAEYEARLEALKAEYEAKLGALKSEGDQSAGAVKAENEAKLEALRRELTAEMEAKLKEAEDAKAAALAGVEAVVAEKEDVITKYVTKIRELEITIDKYRAMPIEEIDKLQEEIAELRKRIKDFEKAMKADDPRRRVAELETECRHLKEIIEERDWSLDQFNLTPPPDMDVLEAVLEKLRRSGAPPSALDAIAKLADIRRKNLARLRDDMNKGLGSYGTVTDLVLEANQLNGISDALKFMAQ